jgi:hypothetical protein
MLADNLLQTVSVLLSDVCLSACTYFRCINCFETSTRIKEDDGRLLIERANAMA